MELQKTSRQLFEQVIKLFGYSAIGGEVPAEMECDDWTGLKELAKRQGVWAMLTCLLKSKERWPSEVTMSLKQSVLSAAMLYYRRQENNLFILSEMESKGLRPIVMKGMAVAQYYAVPEVRLSADMDILVSENELERALCILESNGYSGEVFQKGMYHVAYTHPAKGMIEVHVDLYNDFMQDIWFEGVGKEEIVQEEYEIAEAAGTSYKTLKPTDQMIFLALHMAKHFIAGGISLRMLMDISLFARAKKNDIDRQRFWKVIRQAKLFGLMTAVFSFAEKYWGFSQTELLDFERGTEEQIEALTEDIFRSGGEESLTQKDRTNGWYLLHKEKILKGHDGKAYSRVLFFHTMRRFAGYIFQGRRYLAKQYPCIEKWPVLLPFVWVHWIVVRGFNRIFRWKEAAYYVDEEQVSEEAKQRLELFRKMKMV